MRLGNWKRDLIQFALISGLSVAGTTAQPYQFQVLVDSSTPRPDGGFFFRCLYPVLDGGAIVLHPTAMQSNLKDSIWTLDPIAHSFAKLVGLNSAVPGGTGNFTQFDAPPILKGTSVVFSGRDASQQKFASGLYGAATSGAGLTRFANYLTADPAGGGDFTGFEEDGPGGFAIGPSDVVFEAQNSNNVVGIYAVRSDGSSLMPVAVPSKAGVISRFVSPAISGSTVVFCSQTSTDAADQCSALYAANLDDIRRIGSGAGALTLVDAQTPLPGNANPKFLTTILARRVQLSGDMVVFEAADVNSSYRGIFKMPASGGRIEKIVAGNDSLPGLGAVDPSNSFTFAVSGGRVAFKVQDTAGASGLFLFHDGVIRRMVGSGDKIDGRQIRFFGDLSSGALSGSNLVFWASLIVTGAGQSDEATVLASPGTGGMTISSVVNAGSFVAGAVSPGEIVTVTGSGIGPPAGAVAAIGSNLQVPTLLAATRLLFDGIPAPLLYVSDRQVNAVAPFSLDGKSSTQLVVEYQAGQSDPVMLTVETARAGLFSADSSGTGQGAILNADGGLNTAAHPAPAGSVISLWGTGQGQTEPPGMDGLISPTALSIPLQHVSVMIGSRPAELLYAGSAPGLVSGAFQINARIPADTPSGNVPVIVTIGNSDSQPNLTVAVGP